MGTSEYNSRDTRKTSFKQKLCKRYTLFKQITEFHNNIQ